MRIPFTQYLMPDGRKVQQWIDLGDDHPDVMEKAQAIISAGYRFEMEMLRDYVTCSFTITDPEGDEGEGADVACELAPNGPKVIDAICKLVREFDLP